MMLKHLPNFLTLCRLVLIVPFLLLLHKGDYSGAFYIYVVAGITDGLDGWLARHFHWQSRLGSFIDPVADKLLISLSFISLALIGMLPWWLVILVFMRDFTISIGVIAWYYFFVKRIEFQPTLLSKLNTVLQLVLVTASLFQLAFFDLFSEGIIITLISMTTVTTTITYIDYVWTWGRKACLTRKFCRQ